MATEVRMEEATATATLEAPEGEETQPQIRLNEFLDRFRESMTNEVVRTYTPTYRPEDHRDMKLPELLRRPMGKQGQTIKATVHSLWTNRGTTIVGEMGCGKTMIAIAAAKTAGFKRIIVVCPPHLVGKWKREVGLTLREEDAQAVSVESVTELQQVVDEWRSPDKKDITLFVVMSHERAKLTHSWRHAARWQANLRAKIVLPEEEEEIQRETFLAARCPDCAAPVRGADGNLAGWKETNPEDGTGKKKLTCQRCGAPIWQATRVRNHHRPRVALADYIKKRVKGFFDLFIGDEIHEFKEKDSGQGIAAGNIAQHCGKSLALTGTMMGGYASSIFHLLYRFHPEFREHYAYEGVKYWIQKYGFYETTEKFKDNGRREGHGTASIRRISGSKRAKEIPGLMPDALLHLISHTIFVRLSDVSNQLPDYSELIITSPTDRQKDETGWSQDSAYEELKEELRKEITSKGWKGKITSAYLQTLLSFPDGCTKGAVVKDPETGATIVEIPELEDRIYPKEKELIDLLKDEKAEGRRCVVYAAYTDTRDITGRLAAMLNNEGIKTRVMKASNPSSSQREEWLEKRVEEGTDAVICNPRLVQTGLDLIHFPTLIWFQPVYSVYTMRQASRRSWRIGQKQPVRVYYMTYDGCMQTDALKLISRKTAASLTVEGELPQEGLSSYGDTSDNVYIALAKQLVGETKTSNDELEHIIRESRLQERRDERDLLKAWDAENLEWSVYQPEEMQERPKPRVMTLTGTGQLLPKEPILAAGKKGRQGQLTMFSPEEYTKKEAAATAAG